MLLKRPWRKDIAWNRISPVRCTSASPRGARHPDGRWCCYTYEEILKRDKLSLDLFWIKDQSLTDADSLPPPDVLATEIADELEAAFDLFSKIAAKLPKTVADQTQ